MASVGKKLLLCVLLLLAPLTSWAVCSRGLCSNTQYDGYFREGALRYMDPWIEGDWAWWKAQCYQESLLDPRAVSLADAQGLCQIRPSTWYEQSKIMGINASPFNPRASSLVGAAYMGRQMRGWKSPRPNAEVRRWGQGSYNYGIGNMLKAQKRASGTLMWVELEPYLPLETRTYVSRIDKWHKQINEEAHNE